MSCHSTSGGLLSLRMARAYSGLSDRTLQALFHALKREGAHNPDPDQATIGKWHTRQRTLIKHAPLSDKQKETSELDLLRARHEDVDGPTFHAWSRIEVRARQEAVLRSVKSLVVDLEEPGSQADQYELGPDGRPLRVWYASYGSNLNADRFNTYIAGGTPEGSTSTHAGARDKTLPEDDIPIRFAGRMHFAGTSGRWGGGGVAFMDNDDAGHALGRAYNISIDQFDDVVAQENGRTVGSVTVDTKKVLADGKHELSAALYGTMVHIGDYQGAPVFTFTGDFTAQQALIGTFEEKGKYLATNKPSDNYVRMIGSGLHDTFAMAVPEQADYLRGALGAETFTRTELIKILRTPPDPVKPRYSSYSSTGGGLGSGGWGTGSGSSSRYGRDSLWDSSGWDGGYDTSRSSSRHWLDDDTSSSRGSSGSRPIWDDEPATGQLSDDEFADEMARFLREDPSPAWFNDPHFDTPRSSGSSSSPAPADTPRVSGNVAVNRFGELKRCPMCTGVGHSMHDCPTLRGQDSEDPLPPELTRAAPVPARKPRKKPTRTPKGAKPGRRKPRTGQGRSPGGQPNR